MKNALMLTTVLGLAVAIPFAMAEAKDIDKKVDMKFEKVDTNGDGMISEAEHTAASDKMFDESDADNNGSVSKAEMKSHMEAKKDEWKDEE